MTEREKKACPLSVLSERQSPLNIELLITKPCYSVIGLVFGVRAERARSRTEESVILGKATVNRFET